MDRLQYTQIKGKNYPRQGCQGRLPKGTLSCVYSKGDLRDFPCKHYLKWQLSNPNHRTNSFDIRVES